MSSETQSYAYIRVTTDEYPAIVVALGYDDADRPRGLRVGSGKTLAELAQLALSKSKSDESKIARDFFSLWSGKTKAVLGPKTRKERIKAAFESLSDDEKAELIASFG